MVKKVSRFSSIKRAACFCFSKDEQSDKKKKKKKKSSNKTSFIPIFNEPSSIEKILEDAERHSLLLNPNYNSPSSSSQVQIAPPPSPPKAAATSPSTSRIVDQHVPPKVAKIQADNRDRGYADDDDQVPHKVVVSSSVTKIQAAYRGYVARRGYKALKGLVRLQGVTNSESVKRQIMNAMKTMQSFSKLQTEIRLLRIQILESKALQRKTQLTNNNNINNESATTSLSKVQLAQSNDWDDSMVSMHERESRLQKKQEAILLKEKAMSYAAYTREQKQQHLKLNPHPNSHDLPCSWSWNWIDHKLPLLPTTNYTSHPPLNTDPSPMRMRYYYPRSRPSSSSACAHKFNDVDSNSLVSCPAFSSPHSHSQRHYMEQTASTKAKKRPKSNPRQRMIPGMRSQSPGTESSRSRRFSFPTTPISGSSKFKSESFEQQGVGVGVSVSALHHKVDQLSMVGSPTSVNSRSNILHRKPFNPFV